MPGDPLAPWEVEAVKDPLGAILVGDGRPVEVVEGEVVGDADKKKVKKSKGAAWDELDVSGECQVCTI
jgi:hypothetical protein